jgi:predicted  nucleic acid-binding Zn-ribbon protein
MPPAQGRDTVIFEGLKKEVKALKSRWDSLEEAIQDLKSGYDTHQKLIESHREHIVGFHKHLKTLNTSYQGEELELEL